MTIAPLNIGIIGAGNFCEHYHAPALSALKAEFPGLELKGICDLNLSRAQALAGRFGIAHAYEDYRRMLDTLDLDAVYVVVPPGHLKDLVRNLSARKLPVFMEKPPGLSSADTLEMAALLHRPHLVGFNRRFMPLTLKLTERLPELGPLSFIEGRMLRYKRLDDNFIFGTGIHAIDMMLFLGGPARRVDVLSLPVPGSAANACHLLFHYRSGAAGTLLIHQDTGCRIEHYAVHSAGQYLLLKAPYHYASDFPGGLEYHAGPEKREEFKMPAELPDWEMIGVGNEARAFLRALADKTPLSPTLTECVASMKIAESACRGESIQLET